MRVGLAVVDVVFGGSGRKGGGGPALLSGIGERGRMIGVAVIYVPPGCGGTVGFDVLSVWGGGVGVMGLGV